MKLNAEISGGQHRVEIRREGTRVTAQVGERRYTLEAREPETGVYLLTLEGRVYECRVEPDAQAGTGTSRVEVRQKVYEISLSDPKRLRTALAGGASASGRAIIKAPMPGKVVRVLTEVGAQVEAGDGLVVVEAMKMQNEMKSPKAGTVVELHARTGATVNAGEVLVDVE